MGRGRLASIDAVLAALPELVASTRTLRGLTIAAASKQVGCSAATLYRIERREVDPSLRIVRLFLAWVAA